MPVPYMHDTACTPSIILQAELIQTFIGVWLPTALGLLHMVTAG